ncbi:UNVERIFIED_CONTAM: hypothetical protein PYX00_006620 [Menopon gallinae]|uniref:Group XV phospholipase A2 n=1 Tax=Menopon gallinae TaxID=328185 RepID=A0AAW2HX47_9NEOP
MTGVINSLLLLIVFLSCSKAEESSGLHPVIFVPGDGGSQLEAKLNKSTVVHYICQKKTKDFFNIWLNIELLVPLVIDCWIDNMVLQYNNQTRKTSNANGVEIRVSGFGNSSVVEWIDPSKASPGAYFKDIAEQLVQIGYERDKSIRGAPYDFRKGPNESEEFFDKMKILIEETYSENNNKSVVLITHSMGGLMAQVFLQKASQNWKDKYVRALISLAGPWGGSVKALKVYAVGDNLGSFVLRESIVRAEQISSPSLAWLLPSKFFWKENEVLVQTPEKNYTHKDYEAFFNDIGFPNGWEMYKDIKPYADNFNPPGVEIHCLHGYGMDTTERLFYKNEFESYPVLITGDGDGTVNRRSLEGCLHWKSLQKQKIYYAPFNKIDHMGVLRNKDVLGYIVTYLLALQRSKTKKG